MATLHTYFVQQHSAPTTGLYYIVFSPTQPTSYSGWCQFLLTHEVVMETAGETLATWPHWGSAYEKELPRSVKVRFDSVTTFKWAAHGFRRSGLFPLNPNGIDISKLKLSKVARPCCTASEGAAAVSVATVTCITSEPCPSASYANSPANSCKSSALLSIHYQSRYQALFLVGKLLFCQPFKHFNVPKPRKQKAVNQFSERLPKAISGFLLWKCLGKESLKRLPDWLKVKKKRRKRKEKTRKGEKWKKKRGYGEKKWNIKRRKIN